MTDLVLDWCSYDAAKYACTEWHYSECMPSGKTLKVGVWENDEFIGVVIFSHGATPHIATPYGRTQHEVCECTRIALTDHETPVTRILSISLKLLRERCPGIDIVVSFADPTQGHDGTVYQAANWYYEGRTESETFLRINGERYHPRSAVAEFGTRSPAKLQDRARNGTTVEPIEMPGKHKYSYPFDPVLQDAIAAIEKPYP